MICPNLILHSIRPFDLRRGWNYKLFLLFGGYQWREAGQGVCLQYIHMYVPIM